MLRKHMKKSSRFIQSDQNEIHPSLFSNLERVVSSDFKKPVPNEVTIFLQEIELKIQKLKLKGLILDACCGVGLSAYKLAEKYDDYLVLGIDKSTDRIERKNFFKKSMPSNCVLARFSIIDIWISLSKKNTINVYKQYLLYPNPYPKKKHLKLRWYGMPAIKFLFESSTRLEVRSNWKQYLQDFILVAEKFLFEGEIRKLNINDSQDCLTLFEKKYFESGHELYTLILTREPRPSS